MKKFTRKIQIGVMGSCSDLNYSKKIEKLAEEVGFWVAKKNATLLFGAEKDFDSLSTAAARGAKKAGGLTIGITYGKGLTVKEKNSDVVIATGLERGGGRELSLVLSCDAIITLSGGSGTLTEIAIAYQANVPVVVLKNTGGWSEKLAETFLDDRRRFKIREAKTPKEAVELALDLAQKTNNTKPQLQVVASTANDILLNEQKNVIRQQSGGPALFIKKVLEENGLTFNLVSPPPSTVEILITKNGEFGKIKKTSKKQLKNYSINASNLLISTILDDVSLNELKQYTGSVFLDIQGFVRDGTDFGRKKQWNINPSLYNSFFCLKGTEEEVTYIPKKLFKKQKNKLLIITRGTKNILVYYKNKKFEIPTIPVKTNETIGAGDTFFAQFVSEFVKTQDVLNSIKTAVTKTSEFLKGKV